MDSLVKCLLLIVVLSFRLKLVFAANIYENTRTCAGLFSQAISIESLNVEFAGARSDDRLKKAYKKILESNNPEIMSSLALILTEAEPHLGSKTTQRDINMFKDSQGIGDHDVPLTSEQLKLKYKLSESYIKERVRRIKITIENLIITDFHNNDFAIYSKPFIELLKEKSILINAIIKIGLHQKLKEAGLLNTFALHDVMRNIEMLKYILTSDNQQLKESVALLADIVIKENKSINNHERVYSIFMRFLRLDPTDSKPLVKTVGVEYGISDSMAIAVRDKALMVISIQLKKAYDGIAL